jgi:hypothetical protein
VVLIECGTHALVDAAFDGVTKASEHKLARRLLHALDAGMLLLTDGNFSGHELVCSLKCEAARDHTVSALTEPAQARRNAVRDILDDLLPRRRDRQCERVKKPAKNTFLTKKRDTAQPAAKASYKIRILRKMPPPAQIP